jgi:hypothetical protein
LKLLKKSGSALHHRLPEREKEMLLNIDKLIWLFPIVFILHDFEELILFEPWLKKNASDIMQRVKNKVPTWMETQLKVITQKTTIQFAFPICLIYTLTCIASLLAAEYDQYSFFILSSGLFFVHGFMHLGQAILLRRYVPAIITSALVAIPYGAILFWRLLAEGIVDLPSLLIYFAAAILLAIPFILGMHIFGEFTYKKALNLLVG